MSEEVTAARTVNTLHQNSSDCGLEVCQEKTHDITVRPEGNLTQVGPWPCPSRCWSLEITLPSDQVASRNNKTPA